MQLDHVGLDTQVSDADISAITVQGLYNFLTSNIINGSHLKSIAALNGDIQNLHTIQAALNAIHNYPLAVKIRPLKEQYPAVYFKVMIHNLPMMDVDSTIHEMVAEFKGNYYHINRMIISTKAHEALLRHVEAMRIYETSKLTFECGPIGKTKTDSKKSILNSVMEKVLVITSEYEDAKPILKRGSVEKL